MGHSGGPYSLNCWILFFLNTFMLAKYDTVLFSIKTSDLEHMLLL